MKFYIPINESVEGGSQTVHVVDTGSTSRSTNRKVLHEYFRKMGVPNNHIKRVMKLMGFVGDQLTITRQERIQCDARKSK